MLNSASMTALEDLEIGDLAVSPSRRLIVGPTGSASLEPLVMQLLLLLAEAEERVLSRHTLFDKLWNSAEIGDDSLNRLAAALRRSLAKVGSALSLETVPRSGYRLAGVASVPGEEALPKSGMTRRGWLVAGGSTLLAGGGIGWWALQPSKEEERGRQLAQQGERMLDFDVPGERDQTIKVLSEAASLRPSDARLWGLLAYAKARSVSGGERQPDMSEMMAAENAIARARALQADEPNAELALLVLSRSPLEWLEADRILRDILRRDPANVHALSWLVALTQSSGHVTESWVLNERHIEMSPLSPEPLFRRALKFWIFGQVDRADRVIDPLLRLWPTHPWVWNARFLIYAFTGRPRAALMMMEDSGSRPPRLTSNILDQWKPTLIALERPSRATVAAAREANLTAATNSPGQAAYAVLALSELREVDAAFEVARGFLLSRGQSLTRSGSSEAFLLSSPSWKRTQWLFTPATISLRSDPRFPEFAEQIGLAAYWQEKGPPDAFLSRAQKSASSPIPT